jgi:adenylate cyclase, class 2
MLEIELKARVPDLEPVRSALLAKGARYTGRVHEHDIYYNAPHRNFARTDEALRVRYAGGKSVVTYKGAKIKDLGLKAREELNTAVESGEVIGEILARLGFTKTAEVDKWRENYRFGDASIALDEVERLGKFVEIEVIADTETQAAAEKIDKIKKELGISGEAILASYLELLQSGQ